MKSWGPLPWNENDSLSSFSFRSRSEKGDYSEETAREIDCEVRRIIDEQYGRVRRLLEDRKAALQQGAQLLLEREVMTGAELKAIMESH